MNPRTVQTPTPEPDRRRGRGLGTFPWLFLGLLLLVPAVAMRLTDEVDWRPGDFLVFGVLLLLTGLALELALRLIAGRAWRVLAAAGVTAVFLWVWAELAVGVFFA